MFKKGRKNQYSVRVVKIGRDFKIKASVVLLIFAVVISLLLAFCGKKDNNNLVSSSIVKTESVVSSEISKSESEIAVNESSSQQSSSSSQPAPSVAPKPPQSTSQNVTVNSAPAANNSSLVYDINSAASNWTYVVDKSKPVPLQPRVDNSFFSSAMFVGDSITTGIDLYSIVKGAPVIAYTGINTNTVLTRQVIKTSQGKVTFLKQMSKYNPKHIYIMMGINGIAFQSKSNLISGYGQFVDKVKAQHPNAIIYLQSILPVTAKKQNNDSRFKNSKINDYNAAIANLAKEKGVYYLNVAEAFKDGNGNLPANASSDGIHFGPAYYRRWIEYLKTHTVYTGTIPTPTPSSSSTPQSSLSTSSQTSSIPIQRPAPPPSIHSSSSSDISSAETSTQQ